MTRIMQEEYWLLVQDNLGPRRRLFVTEEGARRSASTYNRFHGMIQGGQLWRLSNGQEWVLVEDIQGCYNPTFRGLYS